MGKRIDGMPTSEIARAGIAIVPEGRRIFPQLTVLENLELGGYMLRDRRLAAERIDSALELFPRLAERRNQVAGTLSGGEQQMLAIGRALMASPKVLLLDEPSLGLAPMVTRQIFQIIKALNAEGTTILLVEQNARLALAACDRAYILETGRMVLSGPGRELLESEEVKRSYLGGGAGSTGA